MLIFFCAPDTTVIDPKINLDLHLLLDGVGGARFETGVSRTPVPVLCLGVVFVPVFVRRYTPTVANMPRTQYSPPPLSLFVARKRAYTLSILTFLFPLLLPLHTQYSMLRTQRTSCA